MNIIGPVACIIFALLIVVMFPNMFGLLGILIAQLWWVWLIALVLFAFQLVDAWTER